MATTKKKKKSPSPKKAAKKATPKKKTAKKATSKTSAKKKTQKKTAKKATKKTAKKTPKKTAKKATKKAAKKASTKAAAASSGMTVVQHVFIPAPPATIFRMLTDPTEHGAFTGTVCRGEPVEGGEFVWGSDYMWGRYEALDAPRLIRCTWQTTEWPKGAAPSQLEFVLEAAEGGTELTMTHSELPASQADDYRQGWIDSYWNPLIAAVKGEA